MAACTSAGPLLLWFRMGKLLMHTRLRHATGLAAKLWFLLSVSWSRVPEAKLPLLPVVPFTTAESLSREYVTALDSFAASSVSDGICLSYLPDPDHGATSTRSRSSEASWLVLLPLAPPMH